MGPSLWIPANWQFGEVEVGEARQGASRQVVTETIKRRLFPSEATYFSRVQVYLQTLASFQTKRLNTSLRELWTTFFTVEPGAFEPPKIANPNNFDSLPDVFEESFCLALHALCAECALHWVAAVSESVADAEEDDAVENPQETADEIPPIVAQSGGLRWALHSHVLTAITALLRQAPEIRRWEQPYRNDPEIETAPVVRQFAAILLDALLAALEDNFTTVTGPVDQREGQPYTPKYIVLQSLSLAHAIEELVASLPFRFTMQPLRQPVVYRQGETAPADTDEQDYFRVDLINYRRDNTFLRQLHAGMLKPACRAPEFEGYCKAVNIQQAVPWRINRQLLYWVRLLCRLAKGEKPNELTVSLDAGQIKTLADWVKETLYKPSADGVRRACELSAEFLDSPLAAKALDKLCQDDAKGRPSAFYLPWKADYRGRLSAKTPWFTPQGGDLQRALFEFSRGRTLDDAGVQALCRHGGNLVERDLLLDHFKITNRQVVTLAERERWVIDHEDKILASAEAPLNESFWRKAASKPMQFLAFCLAYRQWHTDPDSPIHLPVQIDGTCNGLQHIAALIGDSALARAVNVLPREDGLPGDIYSELAQHASNNLGKLSIPDRSRHVQGLKLAEQWLCADPARRGWLNRGTAKKVVMTIPYGAGKAAQARHVLKAIEVSINKHWSEAPSQDALDDLVAWTDRGEAKTRRKFVNKCSHGHFKLARRPRADANTEKHIAWALKQREWEQKRSLAAYVALLIVRYLHAALSEKYPAVGAFADWLREIAKANAGLPLLWLSPLGFLVCQNKFELKGTRVTARLGSQEVRLDLQRLGKKVDAGKQRDALLPNLIHSLDATHLAQTLLSAERQGITDIGSIHDCLLCHPNDAAALAQVVRSTFVDLYQPQVSSAAPDTASSTTHARVLVEWRDWMALLQRLRNLPPPWISAMIGALAASARVGGRAALSGALRA